MADEKCYGRLKNIETYPIRLIYTPPPTESVHTKEEAMKKLGADTPHFLLVKKSPSPSEGEAIKHLAWTAVANPHHREIPQ
ncbi:rCG22184 [Rattus norvegicus]|uniref:RCG22184 n=1 Tax=Rattus norvegicus TaxID=10116 RepID=A6IP41_RAT|nr:rCG22184 [Rattus norvegicus]